MHDYCGFSKTRFFNENNENVQLSVAGIKSVRLYVSCFPNFNYPESWRRGVLDEKKGKEADIVEQEKKEGEKKNEQGEEKKQKKMEEKKDTEREAMKDSL